MSDTNNYVYIKNENIYELSSLYANLTPQQKSNRFLSKDDLFIYFWVENTTETGHIGLPGIKN